MIAVLLTVITISRVGNEESLIHTFWNGYKVNYYTSWESYKSGVINSHKQYKRIFVGY